MQPRVFARLTFYRKPLQHEGLERWLSGRKHRFAKAAKGSNPSAGSNPALSAPGAGFSFAGNGRETQGLRRARGSSSGPASFSVTRAGPPRERAERMYNVQHWTEMPRGGHFAGAEQPELLVKDLRSFFRRFR